MVNKIMPWFILIFIEPSRSLHYIFQHSSLIVMKTGMLHQVISSALLSVPVPKLLKVRKLPIRRSAWYVFETCFLVFLTLSLCECFFLPLFFSMSSKASDLGLGLMDSSVTSPAPGPDPAVAASAAALLQATIGAVLSAPTTEVVHVSPEWEVPSRVKKAPSGGGDTLLRLEAQNLIRWANIATSFRSWVISLCSTFPIWWIIGANTSAKSSRGAIDYGC